MRTCMLWLVLSSAGREVEAPGLVSGAAGTEQPYSFLCVAVHVNRGRSCGSISDTRTSAPPAALQACMRSHARHMSVKHFLKSPIGNLAEQVLQISGRGCVAHEGPKILALQLIPVES